MHKHCAGHVPIVPIKLMVNSTGLVNYLRQKLQFRVELRCAARMLLNENPKRDDFGTQSTLEAANEAMRESLIQGIDSRLRVVRSDFPKMYEVLPDKRLFLEAAWIKAAADLKPSCAVKRIERLVLSLDGSTLDVHFIGYRHRKYVNVDPCVIRIRGKQNLKPR